MKWVVTLTFLIFTTFSSGQNIIEWNGNYQLQFSDFKSPATQIGQTNIYSLHTAANFDFSFYMSNAEFMFTKNFNSKVNCSFKKDAASLVAPDSSTAVDILYFARYEFDLAELYARKFRKKMYDEKEAFSNIDFFRPLYDETQAESAERHTIAGKETDLGRNRKKLTELHQDVLKEIDQLPDFCKECKPHKKKK